MPSKIRRNGKSKKAHRYGSTRKARPDYEIRDDRVRKVDLVSEEDWDAVADHAAIEWGHKRGPRRGRDADDLAITIRDVFPQINGLFDKMGCCGERKTRVLHRPAQPCQQVHTFKLDQGNIMSGGNYPRTVLIDAGHHGVGTYGIGANHGHQSYGGYEFRGEREKSSRPLEFESYHKTNGWKYPVFAKPEHEKTALPRFSNAIDKKTLGAVPSRGEPGFRHTEIDGLEVDRTGKFGLPQWGPDATTTKLVF